MNGEQPGHAAPWIAILLLAIATALLVATFAAPGTRSAARFAIVCLYILTSIADLLKERLRFGRADAVTLFGAILTATISLTTALPLTALSIATTSVALLMLAIILVNVRNRMIRAHPP